MTMAPTDTEQQMQPLPDAPKWTGYSSCYDCPFEVFLECLLENKYDKLITSGEATESEKAELFLALYSEYHVLSGNTAMTAVLYQEWERKVINAKVTLAKMYLELLATKPDEVFESCLRECGFQIQSFNGDVDAYSANLERLAAQVKGIEHKAKQITEILESLQGDAATKATFLNQFVYMSKHYQFRIPMNSVTVAEYCGYLKAYREEMERLNNQRSDNGGSD